ncbi:MAG: efflux RND transporter permease subunit [Rhodospirillales bacterium]|jgi:hydrophobic/amphiphilic exporter-1 (mainly G- bacteria), HAE1 family|nr:efflux RND transporter permease subunit [Rhodospirillales bacterium]
MIRFFAAHRTAANLLVLAFIVLGLIALPKIKRETMPEIPPREIEVRIPYPGAAASEVELGICQRIEDAVEGVENREETRCEAREGNAIATVQMLEGHDFDRFLNDIKTEVEAVDNFPDDAETPIVKQLGIFDFVATIVVTGPMSVPDLKAYAEDMKDRLLLLEEISQIDVDGFSDHQIRIEIPLATVRQFGLGIDEIANAVSNQSLDLPAGTIETSGADVLIRFDDKRRSPQDFEDLIVIAGTTGSEIRLGDIAKITDQFKLDESKILFDGERAAYLVVKKTKADDTLHVIGAVIDFLEAERQTAPPAIKFEITKNISSIVSDRLNMLLNNGFQGLVLVFLTMWLVFSFRFSFWVAAALPVSFMGAIFCMHLFGYSFDMLSMVGLLIAVGLLVDDAIVIAENIASHVARGKPYISAAVDGINEVKFGVIASFLTTVCVFGALAFLEGNMGKIMKVIPVVLILTLTISIVEAFLVLPHHLAHALKDKVGKEPHRFRQNLENGIEWIREKILGRVVDVAIKWRYLSMGLIVALLLGSVSLMAGGILKFVPFPDIDGDTTEARILLPQGTPLQRTEEVVAHLIDTLKAINTELSPEQPGGQELVRHIGVQYNFNKDAFENGPHVATITADLLGAEIRTTKFDDLVNLWRERAGPLPDVLNIKFAGFEVPVAGRPIDIRLQGGDLARLKSASLELQGWLNSFTGVLDLADDLRPGKPEIKVHLREGATALGLNARAIASQLRAAFQGKTADEIQVGSESIEIDVRLAPEDRNSVADLEYFYVTSATGKRVPLNAAATLEHARGYARIHRIDGQRTVTIQGDIDTALTNAVEIITALKTDFLPGLHERYPGVSVSFSGQDKETAKTGASLRDGAIIGILGVFVLLSFLFRSYIEPFIVLAAIPLTIIGMIWGHMLMGINLAMPSIMGLASLAGVIVNNSILLMEFIRIGRRRGQTAADAARFASRLRFRSILLTSATTIMGLLPLLLERSLQAQILIPLVTSLAFGLFVGTILVLIAVPALYTILDDFGLTQNIEAEAD